MRVRDFQQVLGKFTNDQKGTIISDCPIYIETLDGRLEEIRKIYYRTRLFRFNKRWQRSTQHGITSHRTRTM